MIDVREEIATAPIGAYHRFLALLIGTLIYVTPTTAYGMLISAFARTQIAALFGTGF